MGGNSGLTGLSQPSTQMKDPCGHIDLTPQTWVDLQIDQYIANYPGADKLTIQEFAAELNVANFYCGIGLDCLAGQLCHPAQGVNWIILYAIQEWNNYMNSLYRAIETAVTLMREASSAIVSDFAPRAEVDKSLYGWAVGTVICGVLGTFSALAVPAFMPLDAMEMVEEATKFGVGAASLGSGALGGMASAEATEASKAYDQATRLMRGNKAADLAAAESRQDVGTFLEFTTQGKQARNSHGEKNTPEELRREEEVLFKDSRDPGPSTRDDGASSSTITRRSLEPRSLHKRSPPTAFCYTQWAYLDSHLTALQNRMQGIVAITARSGAMTPILSNGGMASILKDGAFLSENPTEAHLAESSKALVQITALSEFFKAINIFVTIGSDDCKFKGPNGAWDGPGKLSYCTPDGLMMNLIQAKGDKAINDIPNAELIKTKYGYSVEYLARTAWDCQKKYGIFTHGKAPPPVSVKSDCVFAIAVCDCTLPEVAHLRHKKMKTVPACRKGAGLPI
ncbi:hypothetical protein CROQUDRAFT_39536 [Cronartium quercuum f. sp. fusiforme G11]|uniref:DUF7872 domain-containing protein n=1 Tax=Cronartium quercuum f. sp. fusiforme G11 TaxID=708437 RepID=A0A9P6TGB4_9BASI|nr:hypothetical protein CROQUDRAFT_39536 [Cronartium quercuum f. sp. fusiforme G11]